MNWLSERDTILPQCENYRDFGFNDNFSKKIRNEILAINNYTCRYCGGIYPKYLISCYILQSKCNDIVCRACYIITHLNSGLFNEINLYYSEMSQIDIIRKTIDLIIKNNQIPLPSLIDENIKILPISILEFINILNNIEEVPNEFKNYKIFFTQKFNINFIINNYGNQMINFIDGSSDKEKTLDNKGHKNLKINNIDKHILSNEEVILLKQYYN